MIMKILGHMDKTGGDVEYNMCMKTTDDKLLIKEELVQ